MFLSYFNIYYNKVLVYVGLIFITVMDGIWLYSYILDLMFLIC